MLLLTKRQWGLLATQLSALANLEAAALIFSQFISERHFSLRALVVALLGLAVWFILTGAALISARKEAA